MTGPYFVSYNQLSSILREGKQAKLYKLVTVISLRLPFHNKDIPV